MSLLILKRYGGPWKWRARISSWWVIVNSFQQRQTPSHYVSERISILQWRFATQLLVWQTEEWGKHTLLNDLVLKTKKLCSIWIRTVLEANLSSKPSLQDSQEQHEIDTNFPEGKNYTYYSYDTWLQCARHRRRLRQTNWLWANFDVEFRHSQGFLASKKNERRMGGGVCCSQESAPV